MRFLELRPDGATHSYRFHPRLTLLRGLDPAARVAFVGFVHSVAAGEGFDWAGTVEVHGVEMELDRMLEVTGATAEAALIVEAATLLAPSADPAGCEEASVLAAIMAERSDLEEQIASLAEEIGAAGAVRSEMKARLAAAHERLDPTSGARLDQADGELGRAARLADRPDPWTGTANPEERVATLEALIEELDAALGELPSGDRAALAAATATARASISQGAVACPEAAALAEAWSSLHQRLEGLESRVESTGGGTEAVAARLDAARAAARAAEDAAVPREVLADEAAELEALHERVLEMESRTGRAVRRGAARRDFENAQQELDDALDEIGYPTWAAFRMGNGMASVRPERIVEYERARAELDDAEIEWAELMARLERDTELQSVLNAIETALDHAVDLLGVDPYHDGGQDDPQILTDALQVRTVEAVSVAVARTDAFAHLRATLGECGAPGTDEIQAEAGLIGLGEHWLQVLTASDLAAVRALRDRERAAAELKELILLGAGNRVDRLESERTKVRAMEAEVAEHRDALLDIARSRLELHMLAATELAVAEEHDAKANLLGELRTRQTDAEAAVLAADAGSAGVNAVAHRIPRGVAGPIPLVVLMGDTSPDALDGIGALPEDVQIVVVGQGDALEAHVEKLGGSYGDRGEGARVS